MQANIYWFTIFSNMNMGINTKITANMVRNHVLLCCGEDPNEFLEALVHAGYTNPLHYVHSRCFHTWVFEDCTVILGGIGTSSIEICIHEVAMFQIAKRIVLIGSTGSMPLSPVQLGSAYYITQAYSAGTAINTEPWSAPFTPNCTSMVQHNLAKATIVSTDFYYGFTIGGTHNPYAAQFAHLAQQVTQLSQITTTVNSETRVGVDMVDMETAQFFALCALPHFQFEYAAVKGPANRLTAQQEQNEYSQGIMNTCVQAGMEVLHG
jgi:uridine phosphorylase